MAAIFDKDKFKWVNGHHVRKLSDEEAARNSAIIRIGQALDLIGSQLKEHGLVKEATPGVFEWPCGEVSGEFVRKASQLPRPKGF